MKKHTLRIIMTLLLTAICALSLFSCKREPPTLQPESTDEPETTIQLGCGDDHNFVDGYCTECGKQDTVEVTESLEYTLSEDGTYYIVSGIGTVTATEITVPAYYEGKPVKAVGEDAFKNQTRITSVTLPDGIESIQKNAFFGCMRITDFTVPRSLTTVGEDAFRGCKIERVEVKSFGAWCAIDFEDLDANPMHSGALFTMDGEPISKIVFDENETKIKKYTFAGCKNLVSIVLPKKLETICEGAFYSCTALEQIEMFKDTKRMENRSFEGCVRMSEIRFDGTLTEWNAMEKEKRWDYSTVSYSLICSDTTKLIKNASIGLRFSLDINAGYVLSSLHTCKDIHVTIPDEYEGNTVTGILRTAFKGATHVKRITIPETVTRIDSYVFSGCSSLEEVNLPAALTSINSGLFNGCSSLTDLYYGGTRAEFIALKKERAWDNGTPDYTVHCTDGDLDRYESNNSASLEFTLSADKKSYYLSGIGSYTGSALKVPAEHNGIPVISVKESAFKNDVNVTSLVISEGVISIGQSAFESTGLKSLTVPSTLKNVYLNAFLKTNIKSVVITDVESWCRIRFENQDSNPLANGGALILNGEPLCDVTVGNGVTSIGQYQFYGCSSLRNVTVAEGVKYIFSNAFSSCSALTEISFSDSVTRLFGYAFSDCLRLESLSIPATMTTIDSSAFYLCIGIREIKFGGTANQWNSQLDASFDTLPGICTILCSDSLLTHEGCEFEMRLSNDKSYYIITKLIRASGSSIVIPSEYCGLPVKEIAKGAFENGSFDTVYIREGVTAIGNDAFKNCKITGHIDIPSSVEYVGYNALYHRDYYGITVSYNGTVSEWKALNYGSENEHSTSVNCTDGRYPPYQIG